MKSGDHEVEVFFHHEYGLAEWLLQLPIINNTVGHDSPQVQQEARLKQSIRWRKFLSSDYSSNAYSPNIILKGVIGGFEVIVL